MDGKIGVCNTYLYRTHLIIQNHSFRGPMVRIPPFQGGGPCSVRNPLRASILPYSNINYQNYRFTAVANNRSHLVSFFGFLLFFFNSYSVIQRK